MNVLATALVLSGCNAHADGVARAQTVAAIAAAPVQTKMQTKLNAPTDQQPADELPKGTLTLTGVRTSLGNAVNCPEIRSDDGTSHPVSGLGTDVALGDRITVTGTFGVSTRCVGRVLIIESISRT